jgi:hypothetical protein
MEKEKATNLETHGYETLTPPHLPYQYTVNHMARLRKCNAFHKACGKVDGTFA